MLNKIFILTLFNLIFGIGFLRCEDRFTLPGNKTSTVDCQKAVLDLHPGVISNDKTIRLAAGNFEIHFEINDKDSVDWLVICDGMTGKILKDIKLDEER